jgi:hypothetical protein
MRCKFPMAWTLLLAAVGFGLAASAAAQPVKDI